ncbi:MAG TPA: hypothetical protein VJU15_10160 [Gemmatimonadales bacterium]|nr:hypothetical protein [Gemmatimonadales bacterium]
MSARIQNLTVVMVGALAVACSKPPAESTTNSTLTTPAPAAGQPLVSAIETSEHSELKLVRPAEKKPLQPVAVKGKGDVPGASAGKVPTPTLDLGEVTPSVSKASEAPSTDVPVHMAMAPASEVPMASGSGGGGVGQEPALFPERGMGGPGTIIIRGGMGGIDDDCKRHPNGMTTPGYPGGGIAINNRMPTLGSGPVMANNPSRRPFQPGRMGGTGGIGVGRRGIR